jgi:HTH-type transcriptional regulator / antitoxin HigA
LEKVEMTIAALEKKLKPLEAPIDNELLRWLYLHLPPQPIKSRKMHRGYSEAIRILMRESGSLDADNRVAVGQYLSAVIPFVEQYEKRKFPIGPATPEEVLGFLIEQHDLSQYDLAKELGGQPVVSQILRGKRRLTREHIERFEQAIRSDAGNLLPRKNLCLILCFGRRAALAAEQQVGLSRP